MAETEPLVDPAGSAAVGDPPPTESPQDKPASPTLEHEGAPTATTGTVPDNSYGLIFDWRTNTATSVHHSLATLRDMGPGRPRPYYVIRISPSHFADGSLRTKGQVAIPTTLVTLHEDIDGENRIRVEDVLLWDQSEFSRPNLIWPGGIRTISGVARPFEIEEPVSGQPDPQPRTLIVPESEVGPEVLEDTALSRED